MLVTKAKADLRTIASAVSIYAAHAGVTPVNVNNLTVVSTVNRVVVPIAMPRFRLDPIPRGRTTR